MTLEGAGSASTFIDGGAAASVIDINVFGGPEVIITDLTIQNGSADKGAGIYAATSVTINNAVITQNLAANYGGGIYVYDGPLILDNTTVSDNEAGLAGGGIDNRFDSAITNSQILNNRITTPSPAVTVGGAGIHNRSNLTITDSSIVGNTTTGGGGGVFNNAYQDTLTLTNVIVDGNEALTYGAGIYNYGLDGSLVIEDSQVINNTTTDPVSEGAGVYNRGTATITDSTISGNTSGWTAAGIMQRDGVMVLTGTDVVNNATSGRGGGIFVGNGTLELDNSPVDANTAVTGGGGIYAGGWTAGPGTAVTLVDSTISNNSGSSYGGGIYTSVLLTLVSSTLSGNTATVFGGGIYGNDPSGDVMTLTNCTVSNNTADNSGGGVYLQSQDAVLNNCTISSNSSPGTGGIRSANTVTVRNSIIANQISGIDCSMAGNLLVTTLKAAPVAVLPQSAISKAPIHCYCPWPTTVVLRKPMLCRLIARRSIARIRPGVGRIKMAMLYPRLICSSTNAARQEWISMRSETMRLTSFAISALMNSILTRWPVILKKMPMAMVCPTNGFINNLSPALMARIARKPIPALVRCWCKAMAL